MRKKLSQPPSSVDQCVESGPARWFSRRRFLALLSAAGTAAALPGSALAGTVSLSEPRVKALHDLCVLVSPLPVEECLLVGGLVVQSGAALPSSLVIDLPGGRQADKDFMRRLAAEWEARIRRDFENGRVLMSAGWMLSESELALYAQLFEAARARRRDSSNNPPRR